MAIATVTELAPRRDRVVTVGVTLTVALTEVATATLARPVGYYAAARPSTTTPGLYDVVHIPR